MLPRWLNPLRTRARTHTNTHTHTHTMRATAMDRNGKSDPYCVLRLVNEHGDSYPRGTRDLLQKNAHGGGGMFLPWQSDGVQTRVISSDLNPIWEDSFLLEVPSQSAILEITCYDHDLIGRNDLLGTALIPVASLAPDTADQRWVDLQVPEGLMPRNTLLIKGGKVEAGTLLIETCFSPTSADCCPDGSLRLCLQILDKEQLGVPVDGPSALEKAFVRHSSAAAVSQFNQVEDAIKERLGKASMEHSTSKAMTDTLLQNESYLAWAARAANNFAHVS